jgi:Mrp family chromosome partitioning ATPase
MVLAGADNTHLATFPEEVTDALRYLVARVTRQQRFPERLAMLAALRQEGVTYLSRGLALTLAHDLQARVCAVELNWWWPSDVPPGPHAGLAAVLDRQATLADVLWHTADAGLSILPAGTLGRGTRTQYAQRMVLQETLDQLDQQFDILVLDIPALGATSDAIPLAGLATAGCLVVSQEATPPESARQALEDVGHLSMLGVLLNRVRHHTPEWVLKYIPDR